MSDKRLMPPRLRDWREGCTQIGLFVRTRQGGVMEIVNHDANSTTAEVYKRVLDALFSPAEEEDEPEKELDHDTE